MDIDSLQDLRSRLAARPQDADAPALAKVLSRWRAMKPPGQGDGLAGDTEAGGSEPRLQADPPLELTATEPVTRGSNPPGPAHPAAPFPPSVIRPTFGQRVHIAFDEAKPLLLTHGVRALPQAATAADQPRQTDLFVQTPARRRLDLKPPSDEPAPSGSAAPRRGRLLFTVLAEDSGQPAEARPFDGDVRDLPARLAAEQDKLEARLASVRLRLGIASDSRR